MSRSIHETRVQLREARRFRYADPIKRREVLCGIGKRLRFKRETKWQVEDERYGAKLPLLPSRLDLIPIAVLEAGSHVHHPASVTDLRQVMRALPKGVLDGLSGIELRLESNPGCGVGDCDPLTGRLGFELLPGVFTADVIGTHFHDGKIALSAYVFDPQASHPDWLEFYLRLRVLATFTHEVAHRFDWTARRSRGRWRMDDCDKREAYADSFAHEWTRQIVVPYLERAYPHQLGSLQSWIEFHGGVQVSLLDLLEGGRCPSIAGLKPFSSYFNGRKAFEGLIWDVFKGLSQNETRVWYARALHYAEEYGPALEGLESVLRGSPDDLEANDLEALVLKADIKIHQGQFALARRLCERALFEDGTHLDALINLCDALEGLRDWGALRSASLRLCAHDDALVYQFRSALLQLAQANLELGNLVFVRENIASLDGLEPPHRLTLAFRKLAWLKSELACRTRSKTRTK